MFYARENELSRGERSYEFSGAKSEVDLSLWYLCLVCKIYS